MGTYRLAKDLVGRLESNFEKVPYIFTCFQFQKSWDGNKARAITSETGTDVLLYSLEELVAATLELKEKYGSNEIIVIGHSQGASLGMELVSVLPKDIKAKVLVTLDPISRERCNYWVMAGAFVTFDPSEECTKFPSEISSFTQELIRSKLDRDRGQWENWYQQDFSFLHSGEAGYADKNVEVIYDGWDIFAHQYVYASEEVWQRVHNLVGTQLGLQFQVSRNLYPRI
jgi:pimeloyl-ACP methyl ester carboxylesterase